MAEAIPFCGLKVVSSLEVVLHSHLDDAMPLFLRRVAEGRIALSESTRIILLEGEAEIVSVKRPQRMVHKVVEVEPELQLLALGDGEVLEQRHIPIEIARAVDGRQDKRAVLTDLRRGREAISVDVLMRFQPRRWIARQNGVELDLRRAQQGNIVEREVGARNHRNAIVRLRAYVAHAEVLVLESAKVGPALELQDSADLPAVYEAAHILVEVFLGGQFHGISSIEQVFSAVGQNTDAFIYVENIYGAARAVIHHTLGLAEGVVQVERVPPSRASPSRLQGVVVRAPVIRGHIQV